HMRHALPRMAGNILIWLLTPITVGGALYAVSLLRNTYITSQFSAGAPMASDQGRLAWALFALNSLVFFGALAASYFAHDPDEKLDMFHKSLTSLDRTRRAVRKRLFRIGTRINGEIQAAKSHSGTAVVIFIDFSASVTGEDRASFRREIEAEILPSLSAGDRLLIAPIHDKTLTDFRPLVDTSLPARPHFNGFLDNVLKFNRR